MESPAYPCGTGDGGPKEESIASSASIEPTPPVMGEERAREKACESPWMCR